MVAFLKNMWKVVCHTGVFVKFDIFGDFVSSIFLHPEHTKCSFLFCLCINHFYYALTVQYLYFGGHICG